METIYTLQDVGEHTSKDDLWIVVHNKVYNVSSYMDNHPGGASILQEVAGTDATAAFEDIGHSDDARDQMAPLLIGILDDALSYESVQAAPVLQTRASTLSRLTTLSLRTLALGSAVYLTLRHYPTGTNPILTNPRILLDSLSRGVSLPAGKSSASFWKGFATAGAASIVVFSAFGVWLQHALEVNKEFTSFPPRRKSSYREKQKEEQESGVLHPKDFRPFTLAKKEKLSPNVYRFTFSLPTPTTLLNLPTGQHISLRAGINGQNVMRSYTPTSNNRDPGVLTLVIKVYPNGLLTNHLASLNPGDSIDIRGPKGAMQYHRSLCDSIGMIAGGTGITPMYQVMRAIVEDPEDMTSVSLIYANQSEEDILLREELEGLVRLGEGRVKVWYVVNKAPEGWKYTEGFVTKGLIEERFGKPESGKKVMLCGPPGMVAAMKGNLAELGYEKPSPVSKATDQVFVF
ncbi:putative cytochrome b5 reductase [Ascodesmis nigricans]|uniref:NADH-cytochrome b5 reductase 1 n=1 Tax=Ascodesmis nigricans TaxID=341454 RepID=A0A4S2ML04_9PEZI|nr:putative cytochrome b5 reductase [Ascodesmis nigricans]